MVDQIYPTEFQLNGANYSYTAASCFNIDLSIPNTTGGSSYAVLLCLFVDYCNSGVVS